jgi:hypothetical protein
MAFRIIGLSPDEFRPFFGLDEVELSRHGIQRLVVDAPHGFPDRVEMRDCAPGETVLLLNHVHQAADTPYRASHAIFVREGASRTYDAVDEIPEVMRTRLLSLRAFSADGMMLDADVVDGTEVIPLIGRLFLNPAADYIQVHFARRGCYCGRIERA